MRALKHSPLGCSCDIARARDRRRVAFALAAAAAVLFSSLATLALAGTTATWQNPVDGNWTDATKWSSNPNYPDNGNPGAPYSASISAAGTYTVTLDSDITVDSLTINSSSATLDHTGGTFTLSPPTLAVPNTLNVTHGTYLLDDSNGSYGATIKGAVISEVGTGNPASWPYSFQVNNGTLDGVRVTGTTPSNTATADLQVNDSGNLYVLNGLTIDNHNLDLGSSASVYFDGASQNIDNINFYRGGPNGDVYNICASGPRSGGAQILTLGSKIAPTLVHGGAQFNNYNAGDALINNGTINADDSDHNMDVYLSTFINNNLVEATSEATLTIHSSTNFTNSATGTVKADGSDSGVEIDGSFTNHGTIAVHSSGSITAPNGLNVGDGTLTGSLPGSSLASTGTINGNVTLTSAPSPSTLLFQIHSNTNYDSLSINGNMSLAGNLELTLTGGSISSSDKFTVLAVDAPYTLSGSFLDVANGGTLLTTDGSGSFMVHYGTGSTYPANEIVLDKFSAVPEPAAAMLALCGTGLLVRRRRRS